MSTGWDDAVRSLIRAEVEQALAPTLALLTKLDRLFAPPNRATRGPGPANPRTSRRAPVPPPPEAKPPRAESMPARVPTRKLVPSADEVPETFETKPTGTGVVVPVPPQIRRKAPQANAKVAHDRRTSPRPQATWKEGQQVRYRAGDALRDALVRSVDLSRERLKLQSLVDGSHLERGFDEVEAP